MTRTESLFILTGFCLVIGSVGGWYSYNNLHKLDDKATWIDYNERCSSSTYDPIKDNATFYASFHLLEHFGELRQRELIKNLNIRSSQAASNNTICVQVIVRLDQVDLNAINASFENMAKLVCDESAAFLGRNHFKVFVQFAVDTSRYVDGTYTIDEWLIPNVTQACDNLQ